MQIQDLATGLYRLTRDVENPKPDRRVRRDWTAEPIWPAGMRFAARLWTDRHVVEGRPTYYVDLLNGSCSLRGTYWRRPDGTVKVSDYEERANALIEALEPIPIATLDDVMEHTRQPYQARGVHYIMRWLMENRGLTLDDVRKVLEMDRDGELYKLYNPDDE